MVGCLHSLDWNTGLEYWTGILDWTTGMEFFYLFRQVFIWFLSLLDSGDLRSFYTIIEFL